MRSITTLFLLILFYCASAQNVTGIWRGHFINNERVNQMLNILDRYRFEVQIAQSNKVLEAITYSYRNTEFYAKASAKGSINPATGKVRIVELKLIEVRKGFNTFVCSMDCMLTWSRSGNEEFLEGTYVASSTTDSSYCGRGTVFLRREVKSDFYKEPFVVAKEKENAKKALAAKPSAKPNTLANKTPAKPATTTRPNTTAKKPASTPKPPTPVTKPPAPSKPLTPQTVEPLAKTDNAPKNIVITPGKNFSTVAPPVLKSRKNEVVQTITVNTKTVELYIYDNGTIDHDTVSVYVDNKQVVARQMLRVEPIIVKVELDDVNDYHEVVMVAENLGDIPPNTSLMVVKAGDQRYEVRISSNEQKNAVVIFRYKSSNN